MTAPIWIIGNHGIFLVVLLALGLSCSSVHAQCPTGFMDIDSSPLKCVGTGGNANTIAEARVICQTMGRLASVDADLAEIETTDVDGLATDDITATYWVGLADAAVPTAQEWVIDDTAYNGMADPMIDGIAACSSSDCFCYQYTQTTNRLTQIRCLSTTLPTLCQVSQPEDFPDILCPTDYMAIKDRCYRFYTGVATDVDFDGAETACRADGGNLARANQYDSNFAQIYDRARAARPLTAFLIGLRQEAGSLVWRDGTQPNVLFEDGTGSCFHLVTNSGNGRYSRTPCATLTTHYICEHDAMQPTTPGMETTAGGMTTSGPASTPGSVTTGGPATTGGPGTTPAGDVTTGGPPTTDTPDVSTRDGVTTPVGEATTERVVCCPEGSELLGDACFAIVTTATSFINAVNECEGLGGSLARINPPEVQQFIIDYFEANPGANSVWIGLLRSIGDSGEVYTWVTDNTVLVNSQAFWADSQPSGPNGVNCVYAVNSPGNEGSWFLSNCFIQFDYLCQFDQTSECVDTACTPNPCDVSGPGQITCTTPGFGVAECTCDNDGFELQTAAIGPCVDINECDGSPCDTSTQTCVNFNGGFQCNCLPGLQQNPANSVGPCIPIDICENIVCDNAGPGNIFCNVDGLCECTSTGFQLEDANGPCINVNECAGTNACDGDTTSCQDLVGTFTCNCLNGFEMIVGNAFQCSPIVAPCDPNPCLPGAFNNIMCNPTTGVCSCPGGYVLSSALGPCLDINECAAANGGCDPTTTTCSNTDGAFSCVCTAGYTPGASPTSCVDINECSTNDGGCQLTSTFCFNTQGSRECRCENWFEPFQPVASDIACNDINECTRNTDDCDVTSTVCSNAIGTFTCACRANYVATAATNVCQDICTAGQSACDLTSTTCVFNNGAVTCVCLANFEVIPGSSTACQAIQAGCCPPITGTSTTDDDFYLTPAGTCIVFDASQQNISNNFKDTVCATIATSHSATGGQLLVLSDEDVQLDVAQADGTPTANGIPDLQDLVTRQSLLTTFAPAVYVDFRRTSDASSFIWGDNTVLPNDDPEWSTNSPLTGTDLHCGAVIADGADRIGYSNIACSRSAQAFCSVNTVTCPQALTARTILPIVDEFRSELKDLNSPASKKIGALLSGMFSQMADTVSMNVTSITEGSIIVHVELTVPRPRNIRDYEMLKDAIMQLGETDENGYTTIRTPTGETVVLDSNRLEVDDINNYLCREDTCMNGGTCRYNEGLIQAECQCMERFQGGRCAAIKEDTSTALIVVLAVATVVMVIVFFSCFCCLFVLSKKRSQQKNKMVYQYRPPISEVFAPRDGGDRRVVVNTAAARIDERFRRPVDIPRVVRNRGLDRDTEMDSYDNPSMVHDETDVESSVDQKRLSHFERVFYNAAELNSRMSYRGDAASVMSGTTSSTNSIYKPPLSDIMEPVDETREFNTPYTADGTENI